MANATIINNELSSPESGLRIDNPYMTVHYFDKPKPLSGGYMYFGVPGTNPSQASNQKRVYYIQEDGSVLPMSQPVKLSSGGQPSYNGTPAKLAVDGSYSWAAYDKNGNREYYSPKTSHPALQQLGESTVIEEVFELGAGQTEVEFAQVDLQESVIDIVGTSIDGRNLIKDDDYTIGDGSSGLLYLTRSYPTGTKIRARQNAFTNQTENSASSFPYVYDTVSEAILEDLQLGTKVVCCGASEYDDSLSFPMYRVVAGGTGSADGLRYITMDNGLQLQALDIQNRFSAYGEKIRSPSLSAGVLTIDVDIAPVHAIVLTESVSSIVFANAQSGQATTVTVRVSQDSTGGRGINFSGMRGPGGTAPSVSAGANDQDFFVFSSFNGSDWYVFPAGNDFGIIS